MIHVKQKRLPLTFQTKLFTMLQSLSHLSDHNLMSAGIKLPVNFVVNYSHICVIDNIHIY
jgi:hypothetical protein